MKVNKSYSYLLYYINKYIPLKFIKENLENTYIFYEDSYKICLLYKFSGKKIFTDYEFELENNRYYEKTIDVDKEKVVYVFTVPDELYEILEIFIEGKYSKLPEKEKLKDFLMKTFLLPKTDKIFHVLDKTPLLKSLLENNLNVKISDDLDLSDPPNINEEEFIYET